jgi:lysophospholipase L1-like esterase
MSGASVGGGPATGASGTSAGDGVSSAGVGGPSAGAAGPSAGAGGPSAGASAGGSGSSGAPAADGGRPLPPLTIWIAGDSTVMTYGAADAPQEGWGQELAPFLEPAAKVNNQALGGRSTRTFVYGNVTCTDGKVTFTGGTPSKSGTRWERIEDNIAAGDFGLIQFGHNDAGSVCERHVGLMEFKQNLGAMVDALVARKATPILITPMSQLSYANGAFKATLTDYAAAMREVAMAKGVALIDLNTRSLELYRTAGYETVSKRYFMPGETTHFQKQGAVELARLVSEGLAAMSGGLAAYVK